MVFAKFASFAGLVAIAASLTATPTTAAPQVHANVHRTLRAQGTVNLIITMKDGTESVVASAKETVFANRGKHIENLVESLEQNSKQSQRALTSILSQEVSTAEPLFTEYKSFWISNQVFIKDATLALLEKLVSEPSISDITEEPIAEIPSFDGEAVAITADVAGNLTTTAWGLLKSEVPQVWATGNIGQNIVVGTIDAGVIATHEILKDNFRSSHSWFDPEAGATTPYDSTGHGSYTAGILAGTNGVGVAPGAAWITCKGCRASGCPLSDLLSCAQFMTCPTDPAGNNKDCSKAPRLVSNSWVNGADDKSYQAAVNAWHAAGIIPIFAIGNDGRYGCDTTRSPGDLPNVISVGAIAANGSLADFSSKGPNYMIKPELSAPGVDIYSAWVPTETSYRTASGTSAATPHVAGIVALLLSAKPDMTYDQVRSALLTTTKTKDLVSTGQVCGKVADTTFPNNHFGYGRVSAVEVLNA